MEAKNITVNISLAGEIDMEKIRQEFDKAVRAEIDRVGINVEIASKQPDTLTHNGAEYKRVDRKAQEGDVVVFVNDDSPSWLIKGGKPYKVNGLSGEGREQFTGEDGDDYHVYNTFSANRTESNVKVYEPVAQPLRVGDYAKIVKSTTYVLWNYEVGEIVKVTRFRDDGFIFVKASGKKEEFMHASQLIKATEEEAIADKWAKIGRKPNEFKVGDAVRYKNAFTTVTTVQRGLIRINQSNHETRNIAVSPKELTLIFPIEAKFEGGDAE